MISLKGLKPGVSKSWLIALAGVVWSVVGLMLCRLAYHWLAVIDLKKIIPLELLSIALALTAHQFVFSRIARRNIARLSMLTEKTCIFAFQRWKSYLLVGVMITVGIVVRHMPIPSTYLAILYTTIGGALLLASLQYYGYLLRMVAQQNPSPPPGKTPD